MTDHAPKPSGDIPLRTERALQPIRRAFPLVAAILVVAFVVILAGFGFQFFAKNKAGSTHPTTTTSSTTAPTPTDIIEPTPTAVPPTATPQPILPPPPTVPPRPTATPKPVTPGKLVVTGGGAWNVTCPYSDPPNYGGGEFDLANTGGRTVYWSVEQDPSGYVTFAPTSGSIAPHGTGTLGFSGYAANASVPIQWSDHVNPAQQLTAQMTCVVVGGP